MTTMSLLDRAGLDRDEARRQLARGLEGADDGELFLEYRQSEMLHFDNGRLKQATYDTAQGFGLRAVKDEAVGYAHASDLSPAAIARAADAVRAVKGGYSGRYAEPPARSNTRLYGDDNPLSEPAFESKVRLLETIDAHARAKDPRVRQVSVSFAASWQVVEILRADGESYRDVRPLARRIRMMFGRAELRAVATPNRAAAVSAANVEYLRTAGSMWIDSMRGSPPGTSATAMRSRRGVAASPTAPAASATSRASARS